MEGGRIKKKGGLGRVGGRGNEKRNDRAAPDSAALIFNDILQRARVPLMHRHYNTPASFLSFYDRCFFLVLSSRFVPTRAHNASLKVSLSRFLQRNLSYPMLIRKLDRAFRVLQGYAVRANFGDFDARIGTIAKKNQRRDRKVVVTRRFVYPSTNSYST